MKAAFTLRGVEKRYPSFHLGPLDLALEPGTALALIGPNGAGKTTLMDLLGGVLEPTCGEIDIFGRTTTARDASWKTAVGYASEQQPFYERWTARRNLRFLARFFPDWSRGAQQRLVERFDLPLDKKVKTLSKGNRVKLSLVAALAHRPDLLLLDEPTSGLDPLVRNDVLDTLWDLLGDEQPTILYSTHILSDISRLADELAFLRDGKLLLRANRDDLERDWRQLSFRLPNNILPPALADTLIDHRTHGTLHQAISRDFERTSDQLRALGATQLEINRPSLEEIAVHVLKGNATTPEAGLGPNSNGVPSDGEWGMHVPSR